MTLSSILKRVGNKKDQPQDRSIRARQAIKNVVDNGGNKSKAMRDAGFSDAYSKNPHKFFKNKGYLAILDKAGLTDEFLAKKHQTMASAATPHAHEFPHKVKVELVEIDEDHPKWKKDGRKKQFVEEKTGTPISDKEIKGVIEQIPGAKLLYIQETFNGKTAHYLQPDNHAISRALEMGYKTKGFFAPQGIEFIEPEMSPEDEAALNGVYGNNKE